MSLVRVISNAGDLAEMIAVMGEEWPRFRARMVADVTEATYQGASRNLTGHGPPRSYPVPIRTGNLRARLHRSIGPVRGEVSNDAIYAVKIHEGYQPWDNPRAVPVPPRPFLMNAAMAVDVGTIISDLSAEWQRA